MGPYEVLAPLGAGGMGVYRAKDTKLGREVALEILPEAFASDPDRLMRFEREARTLASLNHPHIAQVYGIEDSGTTRALVMELVAGEDLSARIARGPIPLDEALPIARQIAEALEAAHTLTAVLRDEPAWTALPALAGGFRDDGVARRELVWVDRTGRETPIGAPQRPYHVARLSPRGDRALLQIADQERDIWLWEFDRRAMTRATLQEGDEQSPTWLPDGRRFVLSSNTSGQPNLFRQSVDGTSSPEPLLTGPYAQMPLTVTPDGRTLVYFQSSGAGAELWSLPLEGPDSTPRALLTGGRTWGADLSPDGRWLAYHSNESGRDEVYVRPFPNVQVGASRRDRRRAAPWRPHHLVEARLLRRIHGAEPRPSRIRRGAGRLALPHDQGCGGGAAVDGSR